MSSRPIILATRGSALALAQAHAILALCRSTMPERSFEIRIFKTTGDKLQAFASEALPPEGTKGLFTKELEMALLNGEADLAVHSLKDLPTELPTGLKLGGVTQRADVRDVLIYRSNETTRSPALSSLLSGFPAGTAIEQFPAGATLATSSTRRQAQLLALNPGLRIVPIRGNVGTRLQKLAEQAELDGLVLAAAGLERLHFHIQPDGRLRSHEPGKIPEGLLARAFSPEEMLPCVGQAAIGLETRAGDPTTDLICAALNHVATFQCVTAERAFLRTMGGGCLSPVAGYADGTEDQLRLRAVSFRDVPVRRGEISGNPAEAEEMGSRLARQLAPL